MSTSMSQSPPFSIGYRIWCRYLKGGAKRFENLRVSVIIPEDLHLRFFFYRISEKTDLCNSPKERESHFISFPRGLISRSIIQRIFFPSKAKSTSFLNHSECFPPIRARAYTTFNNIVRPNPRRPLRQIDAITSLPFTRLLYHCERKLLVRKTKRSPCEYSGP